MTTVKLTPREIVEKLEIIDALMAEGRSLDEARRFAGMAELDYDRWRSEYAGLMRALGPTLLAPVKKRRRGPGPVRPPKR
jgi:hypothetical protein